MRAFALAMSMTAIALPLLAQVPARARMSGSTAGAAEAAVKQAMEQIVMVRKVCERDIDVLTHLRTADKALTDPMQPENAVQKAYEEVESAKMLQPSFVVMQGLVASERELEGARRSPVSADFGRLRSILRTQALDPASRVVVRNARGLEEEAKAWLKVQGLIADHLQAVTDIASESLRVSDQE